VFFTAGSDIQSCQPDLQFVCSDVQEDDNGDGWHSTERQNMDTRAAVDTSQCAPVRVDRKCYEAYCRTSGTARWRWL